MSTAAPVLVIGPWPPPVHGMAVMHARMADAIAERAPVRRFDVSGMLPGGLTAPRSFTRARHLVALARAVHRALREEPAPRSAFISTSAGGVMWFDAWCAQRAALYGVPVHVHHHSWASLGKPGLPWHRRGAFARLRPHHHWVLCESMRERFITRHAVPPASVGVLSNAAFFPPVRPGNTLRRPSATAPLTLGFFSNVVASKGIGAFLDVIERLQAIGRPVAARVAGPVDPSIAAETHARLAALNDACHVGELRSDAEKAAFFATVHRLLLPSRHVHEAEPLVIIEALSHGVPVIATDRGCLPTAWAHPQAVRLYPAEGYADSVTRLLASALDVGMDAARDTAEATAWHRSRHEAARRALDAVLAAVTRLPTTG